MSINGFWKKPNGDISLITHWLNCEKESLQSRVYVFDPNFISLNPGKFENGKISMKGENEVGKITNDQLEWQNEVWEKMSDIIFANGANL